MLSVFQEYTGRGRLLSSKNFPVNLHVSTRRGSQKFSPPLPVKL
nr:MAG TPA: hypothetical protein [Caudoviricetes sp.]